MVNFNFKLLEAIPVGYTYPELRKQIECLVVNDDITIKPKFQYDSESELLYLTAAIEIDGNEISESHLIDRGLVLDTLKKALDDKKPIILYPEFAEKVVELRDHIIQNIGGLNRA